MTNTALIALVSEELRNIFDEKKYKIVVKPARHNGAFIRVAEIIRLQDHPAEYYQVGFNCRVYAIAGAESIVKKIKFMYNC